MNNSPRPASLGQVHATTHSLPSSAATDAQQIRQQLLRMILRSEAERKTRLKPHLELDTKPSAAELRIGT
jgi:hypothetical protein